MPLGLLGLKVGMTQVYDDEGKMCPVTVLRVGPCRVLQVKTKGDKRDGADPNGKGDGYEAVQIGFEDKPRRKAIRAERGHVSSSLASNRRERLVGAGVTPPPKADCEPQRYIREFRLDKADDYKVGALLRAEDVFKGIHAVDVIGKSKGRGTAGVMKRHNFKGLRASHGVKKGSRQRGSISSNASNRGSGRPKKGIRMAGRYGNAQVTSRNLRVVRIDAENNLVLVGGAVPGPNGGLISILPTTKKKTTHGKPKVAAPASKAKAAAAAKKK
jgi:large subunit ribosomal protein L3